MRCWAGVRRLLFTLYLGLTMKNTESRRKSEINRLTKPSHGPLGKRLRIDFSKNLLRNYSVSCSPWLPLLYSVTVGDPTVRKRDCRGPHNAFFSPNFHNNRRAVMCICYTEMRILFINPRVFALKLSSDHPLGLCVRCFKIADVFVKYSRYRLSCYLRETTKKNSDILLYRKPRDSRRDNRTSVPFVLSPLLSGRNHEPTNKPKKKEIRTKCKIRDEMMYPHSPAFSQPKTVLEVRWRQKRRGSIVATYFLKAICTNNKEYSLQQCPLPVSTNRAEKKCFPRTTTCRWIPRSWCRLFPTSLNFQDPTKTQADPSPPHKFVSLTRVTKFQQKKTNENKHTGARELLEARKQKQRQ